MKTVGIIFVGIMGVGFCSLQQEASRQASMTPEERATADSVRAVREAAQKEAEQRTPAYQIGLAHYALQQRAKDPNSVEFRNERVVAKADSIAVCGEANMKNGFGGYIGFRPYVMIRGAVIMESDAKEVGAAVVNKFFAMCQWALLPRS